MLTEGIGTTTAIPARAHEPARQVERGREERREAQTSSQQRNTQPEELLDQIKSITEDGLYSVRFERDSDTNELVVKIVDSETDEVIREIPQEELLELSKHLEELNGNLVDTVS